MKARLSWLLIGFVLLLPDSPWSIAEAVAGALYLFSGAIFPIDVLPRVLRPIGFVLPVTYWLELLRRSLIPAMPDAAARIDTFPRVSEMDLLGILVSLTIVLSAMAVLIFRSCDNTARERGYIDRTTGH